MLTPRRSERERKFDKRPSAAKRLYGWQWRQAREAFLAQPENALCVQCKRIGRITAAREVDHIVPHHGDIKLFWDRANWQGLCRTHHSSKTARETLNAGKRQYERGCGPDGWPIDPAHAWNSK